MICLGKNEGASIQIIRRHSKEKIRIYASNGLFDNSQQLLEDAQRHIQLVLEYTKCALLIQTKLLV